MDDCVCWSVCVHVRVCVCEERLWNNSNLSKKKKRLGPTGFNCQYKPSCGESCHRPLTERWEETDWGGGGGGGVDRGGCWKSRIVPSRLVPHHIHHTPRLDYPNPDNMCTADTPTANLPALHSAHLFVRLSVCPPVQFSLSHPFSLTTLKVRVGCAQ